jgi:PKD repeat protein
MKRQIAYLLLAIAAAALAPVVCVAGEPHAVMVVSPNPADVGQIVEFDGSNSYHTGAGEGRTLVSYEWDLDGDGEHDDGAGVFVEHIYLDVDIYYPSLKVTDDLGAADTDTVELIIQGPIVTEPSTWGAIRSLYR